MTANARELLRDAMGLAPMERAVLIDALLHTFDPNPDQQIVDAWKVEAESRINAFDAGELTDDAAEGMFTRINQR